MNKTAKALLLSLVPLGVLAIFVAYGMWMNQTPQDQLTYKGQFGDSFGVLNSLFSGLGFAGVAITIWIQQTQIKSQEKERVDEVDERRSLFNLNAAIDAYDQARQLLEDGNNDRRTWIEAARLLGHAKVLGEGVTVDCHLRVLERNKLRYRTYFASILDGKTAAFFYGVDTPSLDADAAALESTRPMGVDGQRGAPETRYLAEASIYKVWEAAQWPDDFDDPLGQTFSDEEKDSMHYGDQQGLYLFLEHRNTYHVIGTRLQRRPSRG